MSDGTWQSHLIDHVRNAVKSQWLILPYIHHRQIPSRLGSFFNIVSFKLTLSWALLQAQDFLWNSLQSLSRWCKQNYACDLLFHTLRMCSLDGCFSTTIRILLSEREEVFHWLRWLKRAYTHTELTEKLASGYSQFCSSGHLARPETFPAIPCEEGSSLVWNAHVGCWKENDLLKETLMWNLHPQMCMNLWLE